MREPSVAGMFYSASEASLKSEVNAYLEKAAKEVKQKQRLAIVCPHAGYVYSGQAAAYSFACCSNWKEKEVTAIIIGPNHTGIGAPMSVSFDDWKTPLGISRCNTGLAGEIINSSKIAENDELAHLREHSCEVQLPFLQAICPTAKIVCICMGMQGISYAQDLGKAVFDAIKKQKENVIVIASSDFTHYETAEAAKAKDMPAINQLVGLDEKGFEEIIQKKSITACGHSPIAAALYYSKLAGAKKCELLKYTNSGETTGDYSSVVAYAALAMNK